MCVGHASVGQSGRDGRPSPVWVSAAWIPFALPARFGGSKSCCRAGGKHAHPLRPRRPCRHHRHRPPGVRNALDLEHFYLLAAAWSGSATTPTCGWPSSPAPTTRSAPGGDLRDYIPLLTAAGPDDRERFRSGTEAVLRDPRHLQADRRRGRNGPCVWWRDGAAQRHRHPRGLPGGGVRDAGAPAGHLREWRHDRPSPARQARVAVAMEFLLTASRSPPRARWSSGCSMRSCPGTNSSTAYWAARITVMGAARHRGDEGECAPRPSPSGPWRRRTASRRASAGRCSPATTREGPRAFVEKRPPRWSGT